MCIGLITRPMLSRDSYLEEYVAFWNAQPEVDHIWVSLYSPQIGEESAERLTVADRERIARELPELRKTYRKLLLPEGMARAFVKPPKNPEDCLFSKMSLNFSADLRTQVEPCVFGGTPDCQPVRMQHQQRAALDSRCKDCWSSEGWSHGTHFARGWIGDAETPRRA